jgi:hypothetical protein
MDTTGTFPIKLLADVLRSRLQEVDYQEFLRRALEGNRERKDLKESFEVRINELLERVDVTRVFDVDGLREVLDELNAVETSKKNDDAELDRYVPRWSQKTELVIVDNMTVLISELLARMERMNGKFVLNFTPHSSNFVPNSSFNVLMLSSVI